MLPCARYEPASQEDLVFPRTPTGTSASVGRSPVDTGEDTGMGKEVGRTQVWERRAGGERGCGCAGGQDTGEDTGMSEVGRMRVWARTVGGERGHGHAGGQDTGEDMGVGEESGRKMVTL